MPESPSIPTKTRDIGFALAEPAAARRNFERAAGTFESACFIQDRARSILLERLDLLGLEPRVIIDLGCGPGSGTGELHARYPQAHVLAIDWSVEMCRRARARGAALALAADALCLPVGPACADLVFANFVLPYCRPDALFSQVARVLAPGGAVLFATIGPETLHELREAWRQADNEIHVHAAFDPQTIGDWLARAGLAEPVVDVERLTLRYTSIDRLHADLRATAATNVAAGRRRSLTGVRRWRRYVAALTRGGDGDGDAIGITCELMFGVAWGAAARTRAEPAPGVQVVPVESIGRRRLSRGR